jgi:hypothetical protein
VMELPNVDPPNCTLDNQKTVDNVSRGNSNSYILLLYTNITFL